MVWRNDGVANDGEPSESIQINVSRGVFSVVLGDDSIVNMAPLNVSIFNQDNIQVRVWFNGGGQVFDLLSPDTKVNSVGYAIKAKSVDELPNNIVFEASLSSGLKSKIDSIQQLEQNIQQLQQENAGTNQKVTVLEGKVAALEVTNAKIATLENKIATLEAGVNRLGSVFTSLNLVEAGYRKIHSFPADCWGADSLSNSPSARRR